MRERTQPFNLDERRLTTAITDHPSEMRGHMRALTFDQMIEFVEGVCKNLNLPDQVKDQVIGKLPFAFSKYAREELDRAEIAADQEPPVHSFEVSRG